MFRRFRCVSENKAINWLSSAPEAACFAGSSRNMEGCPFSEGSDYQAGSGGFAKDFSLILPGPNRTSPSFLAAQGSTHYPRILACQCRENALWGCWYLIQPPRSSLLCRIAAPPDSPPTILEISGIWIQEHVCLPGLLNPSINWERPPFLA